MIGIDLIKISRMEKFIERFGDKALQRFLSQREIEIVKNHKTAAGFWAAKEACAKAFGTGIGEECSFQDIEISKTSKGAPVLILSQKLLDTFCIKNSSLSITHDGDFAIAVVALESTASDKIEQL